MAKEENPIPFHERQKGLVTAIAIILAALLISASIYISFSNIQKSIRSISFTSSSPSLSYQAQETQLSPNLEPIAEVTLDFLYADWCGHCQKMKPVLAELEKELQSPRFVVRRWRDEDKGTNKDVAQVYSFYTEKGMFRGFPTFIINGQYKTEGEMPKEQLKSWICDKFSSPKPSACT
ncbi:MAG: thioredoxin domain-containing protein [Candidatus Anstonellaceae archaeon]